MGELPIFNNLLLYVLDDTKEIERLNLTEAEVGKLHKVRSFISREVYNYEKELETKIINLSFTEAELFKDLKL